MKTFITGVVIALICVATAGAAAPRPSSTSLSAVVTVDGVLARGNGAISAAKLFVDGQYEVIFNRDVTNCAFVASGGDPGVFGPDDAVVFTVGSRFGNTNAVFIQEWDGVLGYDSYSSGFHLVVVC